MAEPPLAPRSAFAGLLVAAGNGRGVTVMDRDGLGLATVAARRGRLAEVGHRVRELYGLQLPHTPTLAMADGVCFAGTAPAAWLAMCERGANDFAARLARELGESASVADQSDGYAVLRVSGSRVRDTLAKLVPVDLHARAFQCRDFAQTSASHMGVSIWRLEDEGESAVFEIAVFRSMAVSLWHALSESAAEFGLAVGRAL